MVTKAQILKILKTVPDPELGISVVDLGLIYGVDIDRKRGIVTVRMTLTSIGCPLYNLIADPISDKIGRIEGVKKVNIELTFEPPWTPEKMSPEAKARLGIL
jgi:metal-sulfur cluster biosynthetic enzyme